MKTEHNGALAPASSARQQQRSGTADIDQLASEIFALLNDERCKESVEDVQARLARAATTLVQPAAASDAAVHFALQELPSNQLEVLLQHLSGMTCAQIAHSLGRSQQVVLKDLTTAYVRLRFSFGPNHQCYEQPPGDGSSPDEISTIS